MTKLGEELYDRDVHFILEILQNADDNSYGPGVVAKVDFMLLRDRVVIRNNELGFRKEDIASICDVGKSTKINSG
eukprot:CAMPEP_0119145248 /NCGR_PEP_ID=MMETSP1310-20130426/37223_1 /TAXON_ID=464262 /ORGANISM="Genus nov. species nov., Strain RCC2339" /LENGTH=74 /DNA_ID=CAMNT_0007137053 /DNA_START=47 /DNA_END=267 /DNA_ORIENTATION=+